jgi:acetyl-CoA acetyltransferase
MRDVAVVAFAQSHHVRREQQRNEVEMVMPVLHQVKADAGLDQSQIDFTCSGSTDYLAGSAFSFVMTLDGVGASPPISESHVEMDGAWALYEAWVKIQTGAADTALVYAYGKSSPGDLRTVLTRQLDPYFQAPLWPDSLAMSALQARACIEAGVTSVEEMAEIASRSRRSAADNPYAYLQGSDDPAVLLEEPEIAAPLRKHDCAPITDGAAAVILASEERARTLTDKPVWIRGTGQALDGFQLTSLHEDYAHWPAMKRAAEAAYQMAGVRARDIDLAEVHDCFSIAELIAYEELGFCKKGEAGPFMAAGRSDYGGDVVVNPRGGLIGCGHPLGATGVAQAAEVFAQLRDEAGARQVPEAAVGLTHNNSGMGEHVVMIYGRSPA